MTHAVRIVDTDKPTEQRLIRAAARENRSAEDIAAELLSKAAAEHLDADGYRRNGTVASLSNAAPVNDAGTEREVERLLRLARDNEAPKA